MINLYEYIAVMFLSLLGVLILLLLIEEILWRHMEKKEEIERKKLLAACVGKTEED